MSQLSPGLSALVAPNPIPGFTFKLSYKLQASQSDFDSLQQFDDQRVIDFDAGPNYSNDGGWHWQPFLDLKIKDLRESHDWQFDSGEMALTAMPGSGDSTSQYSIGGNIVSVTGGTILTSAHLTIKLGEKILVDAPLLGGSFNSAKQTRVRSSSHARPSNLTVSLVLPVAQNSGVQFQQIIWLQTFIYHLPPNQNEARVHQ